MKAKQIKNAERELANSSLPARKPMTRKINAVTIADKAWGV